MASVYTKQLLLDPAMLKQAWDEKQAYTDKMNQYRLGMGQALGEGFSSLGKNIGEAVDIGVARSEREEQVKDFMEKYKDDPMAKAAAYNFISGKDPNAIQSYVENLTKKETLANEKQKLELEKTKSKELAIAQAKNAIAAADAVLEEGGNDYRELALARKQKADAIASLNYYGVPYDENLTKKETPADDIPVISESVTTVEPAEETKSLATIMSDFRNIPSPTTEDIENYLEELKNNDDKSKNFADAIDAANKKLKESVDKDWNTRVHNVKSLGRSNEKTQLMEEMNAEALEVGRQKPFSADDIKNAKPSTVKPLSSLNPANKADREYAITHYKKTAKIINGQWQWE